MDCWSDKGRNFRTVKLCLIISHQKNHLKCIFLVPREYFPVALLSIQNQNSNQNWHLVMFLRAWAFFCSILCHVPLLGQATNFVKKFFYHNLNDGLFADYTDASSGKTLKRNQNWSDSKDSKNSMLWVILVLVLLSPSSNFVGCNEHCITSCGRASDFWSF